jgi:hypothetical protein
MDNRGNLYVTGRGWITDESYNLITIKYDTTGHEIWDMDYNGTGNSFDEAWGLCVDSQGTVCVAGESYGYDTTDDYAVVAYRQNPPFHREAVPLR